MASAADDAQAIAPNELAEARDFVTQALARPTEETVMFEIERLRLHYPTWEHLSSDQYKVLLADWLDDFANYSEAFMQEACRRWRNTDAKSAPTPGQLKKTVGDDYREMCALRAKIETITELRAGPNLRRIK